MKKRVLSGLLALVLALGLLPFAALAAGGERAPAPAVDRTALMDAIAAKLQTSSDGWAVLDMALYSTLEGKSAATTPEARQAALDALIAEAADENATLSTRARVELVTRAMGVDSTQLYGVNSNTPVDNAAALAQMDVTAGGHYTAPWVLLAARQGNVTLSQAQNDSLVGLLRDNMGDGLFGYEWDGVTYADPDTACAALSALAPVYEVDEDARLVVSAVLAALPGAMDDSGSLGSANSDAFAIIGLVALGVDPAEVTSAGGASLVDGLLSYVNETGDGFLYYGAENDLATEQGFRALVALEKFQGEPCDIYDFSAQAVQPGRSTGSGSTQTPSAPGSGGSGNISVRFTLKTDSQVWVPTTTLTLSEGSTVYHAFTQALAAANITAVGAERGYVQSVSKNGVTLAEFDKGPNSGWLYKVNGVAPDVPLTAYTLESGDAVVWYYTEDWTQDAAATSSRTTSRSAAASETPAAPETPIEPETPETPEPSATPASETFADVVKDSWYEPGVTYVVGRGLFNGVADGVFAPEAPMTRAMVMTVLARLDGQDTEGGETWYQKGVDWAVQNGVSDGAAPEANVTREQLVTMLYRRVGAPETAGDLSAFADGSAVSAWAVDAVTWAVAQGILTGRDGGVLDSQGQATRAETAAILSRFAALPQS